MLRLTVDLARAFRAADALMLELNPIALGRDGALTVLGAMMGIDPNALFRHPEWAADDAGWSGWRPPNERERRVLATTENVPRHDAAEMAAAARASSASTPTA